MTKTRKSKSKSRKKVFTRKHYMSGDGMLTSIWGPSLWHYLHTMSFNYPVNPTAADKNNYKKFILGLRNVLPCGHCRENLKKNLKFVPLTNADLENRDKFARYVFKLHETINKMLGKQSGLTFCEVRDRYENFRSRCTQTEPKKFNYKKLKRTIKKREKGCTEPLYGKKAKCIIKIVPQSKKGQSFQMDKKCIKTKT
jgi:hypothetical protein